MSEGTTVYAWTILLVGTLYWWLERNYDYDSYLEAWLVYLGVPFVVGFLALSLLKHLVGWSSPDADLEGVNALGCTALVLLVLPISLFGFLVLALPSRIYTDGEDFEALAALLLFGVIREAIPGGQRYLPGMLTAIVLKGICYWQCLQLIGLDDLRLWMATAAVVELLLILFSRFLRSEMPIVQLCFSVVAWLGVLYLALPSARAEFNQDDPDNMVTLVLVSFFVLIAIIAKQMFAFQSDSPGVERIKTMID